MDDLIPRLLAHGSPLSLEAARCIEAQAIDLRALADTAAQNINERQSLQVELLNLRAHSASSNETISNRGD